MPKARGQGVAVLRHGGRARRTAVAGPLPDRRNRTAGDAARIRGNSVDVAGLPHKPQMAAWLNQWAAQLASRNARLPVHRDVLPRARAPPVRHGGHRGRRAGVQGARPGGRLRPNRSTAGRRVGRAWRTRAPRSSSTADRAGSPGVHTGPEPIRALLARHPRLRLVVAPPRHAGVRRLPRPVRAVRRGATIPRWHSPRSSMPFRGRPSRG